VDKKNFLYSYKLRRSHRRASSPNDCCRVRMLPHVSDS